VEAVLWGAPRGGPRRLLGAAPRRPPCRTLAQRLAARATAALAADFAVDLGDVLLSLALDAPHSRVGVGYNDLGCNTSVAASGRAGSGGGAARAGGDEGQGVGGARVVLRVRELALEGTSVWCSPERERPSAALWPAALDARLRLHGLCLGVAAAGGARAAAAAPPPGADGRQPPRAGEVSIVHRWSAGATLRWRAGGAVRRADVPPTKGVRAAGAACARPPGSGAGEALRHAARVWAGRSGGPLLQPRAHPTRTGRGGPGRPPRPGAGAGRAASARLPPRQRRRVGLCFRICRHRNSCGIRITLCEGLAATARQGEPQSTLRDTHRACACPCAPTYASLCHQDMKSSPILQYRHCAACQQGTEERAHLLPRAHQATCS